MRDYGLASKVIRATTVPALAVEAETGTVVEVNHAATVVFHDTPLLKNDLYSIFPQCQSQLRQFIATAQLEGHSQLHTSDCGGGMSSLVLFRVDADPSVLLMTIHAAPSALDESVPFNYFPSLRLEPAWQLLPPLEQVHLLVAALLASWCVEAAAVLHCHQTHTVVIGKAGKTLPWRELPLTLYAPLERTLHRGVCPIITLGDHSARLAPLYVESGEVAWGALAFTVTPDSEGQSEAAGLQVAALVSAVLAHAQQKHAIATHQLQRESAVGQRDHLVRNAQRGMLFLNSEGNIEVINERACDFLNWKQQDVLERPLNNLLGTLGVLGTKLGSALLSRPRKRIELSGRLDRRNMRGRDLDLIIEPLPDKSGAYWVYVNDPTLAVTGGTIQDETAHYLGRVHQLNVTLHQMKTPLTGAVGYLAMLDDMLKKTELPMPPPIFTTVATIRGQMNEAMLMIDDFRNWVTVGQKPNFEFCDLKVIAEEAVVAVELSRRGRLNRPVRIRRAFEAHVPLIEGDSRRLHQMLTNLLNNAAEAITKEEGEVEVLLRPLRRDQLASFGFSAEKTKVLNNGVELRVRDTGLGMTKAQLQRIFDPEVSFKLGGTGVGLWLVRTVVQQHGGEILVDSELGAGTTFTLLLPQRIEGVSGE